MKPIHMVTLACAPVVCVAQQTQPELPSALQKMSKKELTQLVNVVLEQPIDDSYTNQAPKIPDKDTGSRLKKVVSAVASIIWTLGDIISKQDSPTSVGGAFKIVASALSLGCEKR